LGLRSGEDDQVEYIDWALLGSDRRCNEVRKNSWSLTPSPFPIRRALQRDNENLLL